MNKRIPALLLAVLLLLCAGCGKKEEDLEGKLSKELLMKMAQAQMEQKDEPTPAPEQPTPVPEQPTAAPEQPDPTPEKEPEDHEEPDDYDGPDITSEPAQEDPMYVLKIEGFDGEPMDYGTEDWGNNSFTRAYLYDGMVKVIIGRVEEIRDDESALEWIAERAGAVDGVDGILFTDLYTAEHAAWILAYTSGGNEDTRKCMDVYFVAEDAMHWVHTATPIDWYDDYSMKIERWVQSLYLEQWN